MFHAMIKAEDAILSDNGSCYIVESMPIRDIQMGKRKHPSVGDIVYWEHEGNNRQYYVVLEINHLKILVVYLGGDIFYEHYANKPVSWSLFGLGTSWWILEHR